MLRFDMGANVESYDNIDQAIAAMILGNVDAVVYDEPRLRYFANNQGRNKVRLVETVFESQDYGIAFVSGSPLLEEANVALLSMQEDGALDAIHRNYFGAN
jgi:ABC-type amino acid transport substrate-binding protein